MLEQFIKSIIAHFVKLEPMNAYIQKMPIDVQYPCYLVNKCDINTNTINNFYFINTVTLYVRLFGKDEVDLKNKSFKLVNSIFEDQRKIPILNIDGTPSNRFVRIENIESIDIVVDENEIYCTELNFSFDTTHIINSQEFELLANFHSNLIIVQEE